jgi:ornithine cyclodeaminase/alanine dehydrogenase-like protein (mu-crystallin family)
MPWLPDSNKRASGKAGAVHSELLLKKEDMQKVYTMAEAIEAVKQAFRLFSEGKSVVPLRTGIGVQDVVTAGEIYNRALASGAGTEITF